MLRALEREIDQQLRLIHDHRRALSAHVQAFGSQLRRRFLAPLAAGARLARGMKAAGFPGRTAGIKAAALQLLGNALVPLASAATTQARRPLSQRAPGPR